MSDLHSELHEHAEAVEPSVEHALPTAQVEPVEPRRRGPGRPKGPPVARRLHLALDAPSYAALLMIVDILKTFGRAGSLSEAIRFSLDVAARTLAPDTALLRANEWTSRQARMLRDAAIETR